MTAIQLPALLGLAALLTITPGPDTMLVVRNALRSGTRGGIATAFGVSLGLVVHIALSGAGLSAVLVHSAAAFDVVRMLGAFYLVWLGCKALYGAYRGHAAGNAALAVATLASPLALRRAFTEGLLTNLLNPKVAIFYMAVLPQLVGNEAVADPHRAGLHFVLFGSANIIVGLLWFSLLAACVQRATATVLRPAVQRWLDGTIGGLMVFFGMRLALESRA